MSGVLRLRTELSAGPSRLVDSYRTAPFHVSSSFDRSGDGRCDVIVQSVGPGHLPGDQVQIDLTADAGSVLVVQGQGANRIYSLRDGRSVLAQAALRAQSGSTLVYLPGELVPFRYAQFLQTTGIHVDASARAVVAEVITGGRSGMGEHFAFESIDLRTKIWFADRLILQERCCLEPALRHLDTIGRFGQHVVAASVYLIGDDWSLPAFGQLPAVEWSAGQIDHLISVRLLGDTAQHVNRAIRKIVASAGLTISSPADYGARTTALHCEGQHTEIYERFPSQ